MLAPFLIAAVPSTSGARAGGEANLVLPDLSSAEFLGVNGRSLLMAGLLVCLCGLIFGFMVFLRLKQLPVHHSMRAVSELIYETCKTYLFTQVKFILILELFIGAIVVAYFGWLVHTIDPVTGEAGRGMPAAMET